MDRPTRRMTRGEFNALFRDATPSTPDDVGIVTLDGRHLRTKDEILEFLAELDRDRHEETVDADYS